MKNALILHGTSSSSKGNWFPWLKEELEEKGYKVFVPDLPNADFPNVIKYNDYIFTHWNFDKDAIIIGHSSGATAILGILQDLPEGVVMQKAILVGGFGRSLGKGWEKLQGLFERPFSWERIKNNCRQFVFIHSDDDPYVPQEEGKFLEEKLGGELVVLKGQKHFSINTAGENYREFPQLLQHL